MHACFIGTENSRNAWDIYYYLKDQLEHFEQFVIQFLFFLSTGQVTDPERFHWKCKYLRDEILSISYMYLTNNLSAKQNRINK